MKKAEKSTNCGCEFCAVVERFTEHLIGYKRVDVEGALFDAVFMMAYRDMSETQARFIKMVDEAHKTL